MHRHCFWPPWACPAAYATRLADLAREWAADPGAPMKLLYVLSHRWVGSAPGCLAASAAILPPSTQRAHLISLPAPPAQVLGGGAAHARRGGAEAGRPRGGAGERWLGALGRSTPVPWQGCKTRHPAAFALHPARSHKHESPSRPLCLQLLLDACAQGAELDALFAHVEHVVETQDGEQPEIEY